MFLRSGAQSAGGGDLTFFIGCGRVALLPLYCKFTLTRS